MKILHSADWHLDAPLAARDDSLRQALAEIPGIVADTVRREGCDLVLLAGDIFDGTPSRETVEDLHRALEEMEVPVFVSPGNHDYIRADSPWLCHLWPQNVHVFTENRITSQAVPQLDCRVYGAAFTAMDCPGLLEGFRAEGSERYAIGILHGDGQNMNSPYCPVTQEQLRESGLDYMALGHIHKNGRFQAGSAVCGWPGCPMGRGYDETGHKGVSIVTLDETVEVAFLPLNTPRFYDLTVEAGHDPGATLAALLPPSESNDYYRVTLTGECAAVDIPALKEAFSRLAHLTLRDRTVPPMDLWANAGEDTLEGIYFRLLQQARNEGESADIVGLAAKLTRQILNGQEVALP